MSASPWAKISTPKPISLQHIMSEEVAKELHTEENIKGRKLSSTTSKVVKYDISEESLANGDENDLASDALIAKMLQQQFNEENNVLKLRKGSYNKTLKIPILFNDYKAGLEDLDKESESEKKEKAKDSHDHKDWDQSDTAKKEIAKHDIILYNEDGTGFHDHTNWGQSDTAKKEIAKHDIILYNEDGTGFHTKSTPKKTENSLKFHWKEDQTITEFSLDAYSSMQLHKMIKNQMLQRVNHVISIGKEAVVLHAECTNSAYPVAFQSKECVLKVFTLTESEFNKRAKYSTMDKNFTKKIIYRKAEQEMLNLLRLKKAGILCPEVIGLKMNIVIMSFIGENCHCAPTLKDVLLTPDDWVLAYHQVVDAMKILYSKARLIHAVLSEGDILWHNKQCYFIDVSQAVELSHEDAFCFLMTDCKNITKFFNYKRVPDIMTPEELFMEITGFDFNNKIDLEAVRKTFTTEPCLVSIAEISAQDSFAATWQRLKSEQLSSTITEDSSENLPVAMY